MLGYPDIRRSKAIFIFLKKNSFTVPFLDNCLTLPPFSLSFQNFFTLFSLLADDLASYFTEKIESIRRKLLHVLPPHLSISMPVCSVFPCVQGMNCLCSQPRPTSPLDSSYSSSSSLQQCPVHTFSISVFLFMVNQNRSSLKKKKKSFLVPQFLPSLPC